MSGQRAHRAAIADVAALAMNPPAAAILAAGFVPGIIAFAISVSVFGATELISAFAILLLFSTMGWVVAVVYMVPSLYLVECVRRRARMTWLSAATSGTLVGTLPISLLLLAIGGSGVETVSLFALSGLVGGLAYRWAAGPDGPAR